MRDDRLHGDNGKWGRKRWCKGCLTWVRMSEWKLHEPHHGLDKDKLTESGDE